VSSPELSAIPGALTRSPVRVRIARVSDTPAHWQGRAEADTAIVAVALARHRGQLRWNKSSRRGPWSDDLPGLHIGVWISELESATLVGPASVQLQLSGAAPAWSVMTRKPEPVELRERFDAVTGTPAPLLHITGDDPLDVALLFIARSDVRSLRSGIWNPREAALHGVPPDWSAILTSPRTGNRPA
jgi:hypothetical protein